MTLRVGVLADLHGSLDPAEQGGWFNAYDFAGMPERVDRAMTWFAEQEVDRVVLAGDLTHGAEAKALDALLERCTRRSPCPVLVVAGNHDVDGRAPFAGAVARAAGARVALATPTGERHRGVCLAGIHVGSAEGLMRSRVEQAPDLTAWGAEPVVLASHYPLLSHAASLTTNGLPHPGDLVDRAALARPLIERAAPTIVVSGHVHARLVAVEGTVLQLTQTALIEPPFDAALVELAPEPGGGLLVTRRTLRAGDARAPFEPALAEPDGAWRFDGGRWQPIGAAPADVVAEAALAPGP